jgi:hypothetical protein
VNLREAIMSEHSKANTLMIADYACEKEENFKELIRCFLSKEKKLAQRAAWSVSWAARKRPDMIKFHMKDLIQVLERKDVHEAVKRNALRLLEETDIPGKFHGKAMNSCFRLLEDPSAAVAIKVLSLTVLFNLSKEYPQIGPELRLIIEDRWEHETAAFKSRGARILKTLPKARSNASF